MGKFRLLLADLLLVLLATVLAQSLKSNLIFQDTLIWPIVPYIIASLLSAAVVFSSLGVSSTVWRLSTLTEYLMLLLAVVVTVLAAVALTFVYGRMEGIARSLPILQGLVMTVLLVGVRVLTRLRYVWRIRQRSAPVEVQPLSHPAATTVLVVGLNPISELYLRAAAEFSDTDIRIAGLLGRSDRHVGRSASGHAVLGTPENVERVLQDLEVHGIMVDQIVITVPRAQFDPGARLAIESAVKSAPPIKIVYLEDLMGITSKGSTTLPPSGGRVEGAAHAAPAEWSPRMSEDRAVHASARLVAEAPQSIYWTVKWLLDRVVAFAMLIVFSPLLLLIAMVALIDVGAPIGFWQSRPGRFGRPFKLYKIRTMRTAYDTDGSRVSDADRYSIIGRFLRASRLDELPQLWNILVGDMAFIGPRPLLPVDQTDEDAARLLVLPGLTGWAQVSGGRSISPQEKAALDIWYVNNASFLLDVKILLLTVRMVIWGENVDQGAINAARSDLAKKVNHFEGSNRFDGMGGDRNSPQAGSA